jgi:hypothetical protein
MTASLDKAVQTFSDPSARVTRISRPVASPAQCALCGKDTHPDGFAATDNFDFEFYGTVYFCADCVGDYARVFGYMSRAEIQNVLDELTRQKEELEVLRASVVNLESIVDAYSNLRGVKPSDISRDVSHDVSTETVDAGNVSGEGTTPEPDSSGEGVVIAGEQSSDERSNESGRDDVYDSPANDTLAELGII